VIHQASGASFPGRVAGFIRVYDQTYPDPSAGFSAKYFSGDVLMNVYVYPVPPQTTIDKHFGEISGDVLKH
jgi:hypothetical protein